MANIKMGGHPMTLIGTEIKVGDQAPDVTLYHKDFSAFKLSDYAGKKILIAVFPSVDTAVCAMQTRRFNEDAAKIDDVAFITVSVDLPPALGRFCGTEGLDSIITASDYKFNEFGEKYGFLIDETRFLARGNVLIGKDGIVKYVEFVEELTNEPNYDLLLEEIKKLD